VSLLTLLKGRKAESGSGVVEKSENGDSPGTTGAAADGKVELPLRGVVAEEQAPPPASGL
jgi:hypothetical protein